MAISRGTMNQFMSTLVCEGFSTSRVQHVLLKYGHENAEMQNRKFDDVTLQYCIKGKVQNELLCLRLTS